MQGPRRRWLGMLLGGFAAALRAPVTALATIAAERKPRMFLLPYGIPMAIGTIFYFAMSGMLL